MSAPDRPRQGRREATPPLAEWKRWIPALAAVAVLVAVLVAGTWGGGGGSSANSPPSNLGAIDDPALTVPASSVNPVVIATDPAVPKTNLAATIGVGSAGPDVKMVQQRLTDLAFAPGPIDGIFGGTTQQAVWAFEKLVLKTPRAQATGRVTDAMWQTMQNNLVISPRRTTGNGTTHVEVYVPEQVAIVFKNDLPVLITHISTGEENPDGTPMKWCETVTYDTDEYGAPLAAPVQKAVCALAKTPGGVFRFTRRYTGKRVGPLGGMMNPVYFNYGLAIHGADNVPLEPASHGCVRINQTVDKTFPSLVANGDLVFVWGEDGKQPEQYTKAESLPSFNYPDPNATTTTSSTTTIPPTTTTTVPATTTTETRSATTVSAATPTTAASPTTTTSTPPPSTTSVPTTTTVAPTTTVPGGG